MIQILACNLGGGTIDPIIPKFLTNVVKIIQVAIPIILVILGMVDLGKAVTSNDEKQMKEAQKTLIKRVIYAILIFFIIAIVKFVFGVLGTSSSKSDAGGKIAKTNVTGCINCFLDYSEENCSSTNDNE